MPAMRPSTLRTSVRAVLLLLSILFTFSTHAQPPPAAVRIYDFQNDDTSLVVRALARHAHLQLMIVSDLPGTVMLRVADTGPREVIDMIAMRKNLIVNEHDGFLCLSSAPLMNPIVLQLVAFTLFVGGWRVLRHKPHAVLGWLLVLIGVLCIILSVSEAVEAHGVAKLSLKP